MYRKIKVEYDGLIDKGLDTKLTNVIGNLGYKWKGQGYNFVDCKRDICFEKEIKDEATAQ